MEATETHVDLHDFETSVQKMRIDYSDEQAYSMCHSKTYRFTMDLQWQVHGFTTELETATAKAMQESLSLLSNESVVNTAAPSVFHSEFDNFDRFLNTLEG